MSDRWFPSCWSVINTCQLQTGSADCFIYRAKKLGTCQTSKLIKWLTQLPFSEPRTLREGEGQGRAGWWGLQGVVMKIAGHPATPRLQSQTGPSICVIFKEQNVTEQWTCSRRISNRVRCKVTPEPDRFLKTDAVVNGGDTHAGALKL